MAKEPGSFRWLDAVMLLLFFFACALAWTDLGVWIESWVR